MQIEEPIDDERMAKAIEVEVPDDDKIQHWFTYHPPIEGDVLKYKAIREFGLALARCIDDLCPNSADKSAAIRKVREAVMTANAAIACCGKP